MKDLFKRLGTVALGVTRPLRGALGNKLTIFALVATVVLAWLIFSMLNAATSSLGSAWWILIIVLVLIIVGVKKWWPGKKAPSTSTSTTPSSPPAVDKKKEEKKKEMSEDLKFLMSLGLVVLTGIPLLLMLDAWLVTVLYLVAIPIMRVATERKGVFHNFAIAGFWIGLIYSGVYYWHHPGKFGLQAGGTLSFISNSIEEWRDDSDRMRFAPSINRGDARDWDMKIQYVDEEGFAPAGRVLTQYVQQLGMRSFVAPTEAFPIYAHVNVWYVSSKTKTEDVAVLELLNGACKIPKSSEGFLRCFGHWKMPVIGYPENQGEYELVFASRGTFMIRLSGNDKGSKRFMELLGHKAR